MNFSQMLTKIHYNKKKGSQISNLPGGPATGLGRTGGLSPGTIGGDNNA